MNRLQKLITDELASGKSYNQIASECGINHVSLIQYHRDEVAPGGKNMAILAKHFRIDFEELEEGTEQGDNTISQNIRALRELNGWTQEALATRMGVLSAFVSALERGERSPGPKTMKKLCSAFGVTEQEMRFGIRHAPEVDRLPLPDTDEIRTLLKLLPSLSDDGIKAVLLTALQMQQSGLKSESGA